MYNGCPPGLYEVLWQLRFKRGTGKVSTRKNFICVCCVRSVFVALHSAFFMRPSDAWNVDTLSDWIFFSWRRHYRLFQWGISRPKFSQLSVTATVILGTFGISGIFGAVWISALPENQYTQALPCAIWQVVVFSTIFLLGHFFNGSNKFSFVPGGNRCVRYRLFLYPHIIMYDAHCTTHTKIHSITQIAI